ncbi:hypothetical protein KFU94_04530 [Chloroflexi bacterium TSY]|nr:hypothetical protein [Chloroflexi bacterium TSY]
MNHIELPEYVPHNSPVPISPTAPCPWNRHWARFLDIQISSFAIGAAIGIGGLLLSIALFIAMNNPVQASTQLLTTTSTINSCPKTISFGEAIECNIELPSEIDSYQFMALAGDKILVRMTNTDNLWSGIRVHDPNGDELTGCRAWGGTTAEISTCLLPVDGLYHVLAYDGFDGSRTGAYHLFVQRLNNPGNAEPILFGVVSQGTIQTSAQMDSYTFSARADSKVIVRMSNKSNLWSGVRLYNPNGVELAGCRAWGGTTAEISLCDLTIDGDYHILAYDGFDGSRIGEYNLSLVCFTSPCLTQTATVTPTSTNTPTPTFTNTKIPTATHTPTPTQVPNDDLFGYEYELWTDPNTLRAGTSVQMALFLRRQGAKIR